MSRRAGSFVVRVQSDLPPGEVWRRLVDLDRHTRSVPFTRVLSASPRTFTARTRLGPVVLDDVMVVDEATAPSEGQPGIWRVRKTGNVIRGEIDARVAADGAGTRVTWRQVYDVRGVPRALVRWTAPLVGLGYRVVIARILAD